MSPTDVHSDEPPRGDGERDAGEQADERTRDPANDAARDATDDAAGDGPDDLERALAAFRAGEPVCVHDFDDREGETDLCYPATAVDADAVARLRTDAGGLVCVALADAVAGAAALPLFADAVDHPAVEESDLAYGDRSSFSLTVNHRDTFTGVTDEDRALTIAELGAFADAVDSGAFAADEPGDGSGADDHETSDNETGGNEASGNEASGHAAFGDHADPTAAFAAAFRVPGHVHLLRGAPGGVAERRGHTELALALADAAGVAPAVVVCEMLDDASGEALAVEDAREYAERTGVPFLEGERIVDALE